MTYRALLPAVIIAPNVFWYDQDPLKAIFGIRIGILLVLYCIAEDIVKYSKEGKIDG